nr:hypothetical protein F07H5.4 - Caenorhabditis elegans [Caenorhabditis elegans]
MYLDDPSSIDYLISVDDHLAAVSIKPLKSSILLFDSV